MKNKKQWELPEYLKPELINLEKRLDEAIEWVEKTEKIYTLQYRLLKQYIYMISDSM